MRAGVRSRRLAHSLAELNHLTDWERRPRGGMRVDLVPMQDLAARLGRPHDHFRSIHVAGTKGKSSTCALIEAGLARAGYRVGRYSSPHVRHITERITVNGTPIGEDDLAWALDLTLTAVREARAQGTGASYATWFDVFTAAAFALFREFRVEWAAIETGLGGRWDSTNIVHSDVAVITNVELEHTEVLGTTRAAIAFEKAGILKADALAVTPLLEEDEAGAVVEARARDVGCSLLRSPRPVDGTILQHNLALVGTVFDALGARGMTTTRTGARPMPIGAWLIDPATAAPPRLPGRMETFSVEVSAQAGTAQGHTTVVDVVLDGAHVPFNLAHVIGDLAREGRFRSRCVAVVAVAKDKDALGLLAVLARYDATVIFTRAGARSRSPCELKEMADGLGLDSSVDADPYSAYQQALARAARGGARVLVTGSLHLAGMIPRSLAIDPTPAAKPNPATLDAVVAFGSSTQKPFNTPEHG